ncbi:hypothetical protein [Bacteroides caecimuris]|uniref:hypothetical protein n=1 Tax=Bacteroides caecimuris TaxID=1796613 RepID=UPI0024322D9E|nr:hypothetical protein [Bacteroides caecimuris]
MMKFKKFLAAAMTGVMMFGMVATAAPAISVYAEGEAAAKSKYSVEVDYKNFTATIKDTTAGATAKSDMYVVLEVLKDKEGTKVSSTHVYPVEEIPVTEGETATKFFGAVVDLSFLKASKEAYIRVHGDSEKDSSDIVTVSPQAKKVAIKYTSGQETLLKALSINKAAPTEEVLAGYEYRTLYGSNYSDLKDLDKDMVEVAGTTLVVRSKAVTTGEKTAPAGVEVKVKIPAAPKAPKVTIDYVKGIFKLPKNAEAQIIFNEPDTTTRTAGELKSTSWKDLSITTGDQAQILGLFEETKAEAMVEALTTNGFTLVVRTKAGKKAASNPAIVLVEGVDTPVQTPGTEEGSVLDEVKIGEAKLTWKTSATGITYTASGADFEYYDSAKSKWVAIKTTKPLTVKTSTSADVKVKVRQAGVKATKTTDGKLPSAALEVTVKAYVAPTPEATPTPTPETSPSA